MALARLVARCVAVVCVRGDWGVLIGVLKWGDFRCAVGFLRDRSPVVFDSIIRVWLWVISVSVYTGRTSQVFHRARNFYIRLVRFRV